MAGRPSRRHGEDDGSGEAGRPDADGVAPRPAPAAAPVDATPSMAQYLEIKAANPDSLLWYRMGDFYELFFQDAVVASEALGIVLTKRGKHLGEDIPMCGVPIHRADEYLQRLIRQGYRVAVCEQLEDPAEARKRGAKAVVRRDVVRLVTPGTLTEDTLLDARTRNYLAALFLHPAEAPTEAALAALDISSGEFEVGLFPVADLTAELARLLPTEIVATDAVLRHPPVAQTLGFIGAAATPVAAATFDSLSGERQLKERLGVLDLGAFGSFARSELAVIGALLRYVDLTQIGKKPLIRPPRRIGAGSILVIDAASRASLELVRAASGEKSGSLLWAIDRTVTGAGARELAHRLSSPLTESHAIAARHDAVAYFVDRSMLRDDVRQLLRSAPDVARAVSRLSLDRGGPRDLAAVRDGLKVARAVAARLDADGAAIGLPALLASAAERLTSVRADLESVLAGALVDEPPPVKRDGGFVRRGFRDELDAARRLRDESRQVMAELEIRYVELTGVKALKIRHNNILGYFVETGQANAKPLQSPPLSDTFRHRQTMANAVRFTTSELADIEGRIAAAGERALALELEIFADLSRRVTSEEQGLADLAAALAELDVHAGLAELAVIENYVRPVVESGCAFEVSGGRHPVVEQMLKAEQARAFIANDCILGRAVEDGETRLTGFDETAEKRLWLVTGPNMAGKSTFLRQNALITVLAQMGAFVPAKAARIGVVDRLFSRVGASDDIARGRSTFMVEMVETAAILNSATARSLVILDEIGRGTATFDGLSIAWATVEHLHDVNRCRALFATHYHELTALASRLAEVSNVTMDVKEWHDEIVFLHKVRPGAADRSYGIQVAKLAGLPQAVVKRAGKVLRRLEKADRRSGTGAAALDDLPLFAAARPSGFVPEERKPSPVDEALATIQPDELSPKQALEALYRLKSLARN